MGNREGYRRWRGSWSPNGRQRRILELILAGKTNDEIAAEVQISVAGVKWHVHQMLAETGLSDRQELARWWMDERDSRPALVPLFALARPFWPAIPVAGALSLLLVAILAPNAAGNRPDSIAAEATSAAVVAAFDLRSRAALAPTPIPEPELHACPQPLPAGEALHSIEAPQPYELAAAGFLPVPSAITSPSCPVMVANRFAQAFVRLPLDAEIRIGREQTKLSYSYPELTPIVPTAGGQFAFHADANTTYEGPGRELVIWVVDSSLRRHTVAVDAEGMVWVSPEPIPIDAVIEEWTGERLDVSRMTPAGRLIPVTDPAKWQPFVFMFTSCSDRQACVVSHSPGYPGLIAPVGGTLRCLGADELTYDHPGQPIGEFELDAGNFRLRFREAYTSSANRNKGWQCATRDVAAGDMIGTHSHYIITAANRDGGPLSVVVAEDSSLYVGEVSAVFSCPCAQGS